MSMVEAIARALYQDWVDENPLSDFAPWEKLGDKLTWLNRATAALRAMETPTEAMVEAGLTTGARFGPDAMRNIWRTMIRAAVAEGER